MPDTRPARKKERTGERLELSLGRIAATSDRADGTFSREDFAHDQQRDSYICPADKELARPALSWDNTALSR